MTKRITHVDCPICRKPMVIQHDKCAKGRWFAKARCNLGETMLHEKTFEDIILTGPAPWGGGVEVGHCVKFFVYAKSQPAATRKLLSAIRAYRAAVVRELNQVRVCCDCGPLQEIESSPICAECGKKPRLLLLLKPAKENSE